ncbi:outer membrane receptor protein involved in Fe transport [Sphingomonas vulcanisoli]|uniref:Outer membrane receptor protein involved in Fe transport n=1 Tax=Sphingomonas vulcanisoli TaxID=1658060 RepID=A0ABX0TYU0_9SPHN|nr:TonB-dependent receptor [Sphingomonas vulcanisoli]NIJ08801.1 outer membrane receptor protein involved in Fe transport [Sphingomonas vulcanisoli]
MTNIGIATRAALLLTGVVVPGLAAFGAASAQALPTAPSPMTTPAAVPDDKSTEIVVTGTRIAVPNAVSDAPITTVTADSLLRATGSVSVGDKLNDLPQIRSTYSQQNSTRGIGSHGINLVDLYGLGTQRTLVLVNGRRYVGSDINNNGVSVDINDIPLSLLERVDVLTGGASSVYGSDAIAGVVNFRLKDHFSGITANVRSGVSSYGDAGSYLANITAGRNFAEGRGNIAASIDYAHQTDFYASDRPTMRSQGAFVVVGTDPAGSPNGAAGGPDRYFLNDVRSATISNGGLVSFNTGQCGRDGNTGAAFACKYVFQPDGSLVPETGTRVGVAPNGNFIGGNGSNLREGKLVVLQPRQDRLNANLLGHFEISPALVPFFEGSYMRAHTLGSQVGPAFVQGATLSAFKYNTTYEQPRLDNPFLSDQARALITQQLALSGVTATGATRFALSRNLVDLGVRDEDDVRQTFRIVGGVRGDFAETFHYEISANYGEMKERTKVIGNLNGQRFLLAMDSARNAAGQIVCRSQIDPSTAALAQLPGSSAATLAADVAACVPLNPFGQGSISQAARNYVTQDTVSIGRIRQTDISGFVSGDSSQWFQLPGGPIGFSIGAEHRRETNLYRQDPLISSGYTFYNAIPALSAPAFEVTEGFGEVRVPLLKDLPLIKEFTVAGSARYSSYKGSAGKVWTYNGNADWAPISDIRFRSTYSRSVRAPNITELYSQQSANFATFTDPCSARNIAAGSATRAANCAAAGIPASYDYVYIQSLAYRSGGNPNLKPEKSDSFTVGGLLTPHWIRGFALSIDYYNIRVRNVISTVAAQTAVNQCYDSATLANPFCGTFQRVAAGQTGPNGEQQYRIIENSLLASALNYASLKVQGINLDASYNHRFGFGLFTMHGVYTHVIQRDQFLNPSDPNRADRIRGELGDPIDSFNLDLDVQQGKVTVGYTLRMIGHMVLNAWEDTHSVQGRAPENADYADIQYYPNVFYHSVRASVDVTPHVNMFAGIENLLNRLPPFGLTGVSSGGAIYDVRGRYLYMGAHFTF